MDAVNKDVTGFTVPDFKIKTERSKNDKKTSRYFRKTDITDAGMEVAFVGAGKKVFMHTFFGKGKPSAVCKGKNNGCEHCKSGEPISVKYRYNVVAKGAKDAQILELGSKNEMPRFTRALESGALNPNSNYVRLYFNRTNDEGELVEGTSFKNGAAIGKEDAQKLKAIKLQDLER